MSLGRPAAVLAVLAVFTSALSACTSNSSGDAENSTIANYSAMSGPQREQALLAAAKNEGSVSVYSSNTDMTNTLGPAFEKKYGIPVQVYRATNEAVTQRTLQEGQSGRPGADIVEQDAVNFDALSSASLLAPYSSDIVNSLPPDAKHNDWTAVRYSDTVMVRNTKLVPDAEVPKTFEELAQPQWKGKLILESSDYAWYMSIYGYYKSKGMTDDQFTTMFKAIAANARSVSGHPNMTSLLEAGDGAIAVDDYPQYIIKDSASGAPVSFTPVVGPVLRDSFGAGLLKNAPHPAAALLFIDWYLTDGQALIRQLGREPTNPRAVPDYQPIFPAGTTIVPFDDKTATDSEKSKAWSDAYTHLLQQRGNVLP